MSSSVGTLLVSAASGPASVIHISTSCYHTFVNLSPTMSTCPRLYPSPCAVAAAGGEVMLEADRPYLKVRLHGKAEMKCCYTSAQPLTATWVHTNGTWGPRVMSPSDHVTQRSKILGASTCSTLELKSVQLEDAGLYQCLLANGNTQQRSHGTYLHVYSKCPHPGFPTHGDAAALSTANTL